MMMVDIELKGRRMDADEAQGPAGENETEPATLTPEEAAKAARIAAAAERALSEAAARRAAGDAGAEPAELGGRDGPSPTRYGDWEKKGVAIDF